jgi:hypothetical protein
MITLYEMLLSSAMHKKKTGDKTLSLIASNYE